MDLNISLTGTDIVAWWGAIVATVVLIWDIYKWKTSGPILKFEVSPYTRIIGDPTRESKKYISANVTNIGDRPTTLTNLVLQYYDRYFKMVRHKRGLRSNETKTYAKPYVLDISVFYKTQILSVFSENNCKAINLWSKSWFFTP